MKKNNNVTRYIYSAVGEKLRVRYYVAVPNVTREFGVKPSGSTDGQVMCVTHSDYLLGGMLTLNNDLPDMVLFDGGYAKAARVSDTAYGFTLNYYNRDHLGNVREVVNANSGVLQVTSGGEVGEEGNVVVNLDPRYREAEIGLPNGVYDILDNSSDTNPDHYSWYRLDRIDNTRYNDMDDKTGRIGFRLHLGTRSFGCVTINKNQKNSNAMWNVLVGIMKRTKTTRVKENRGRQWLNPFSYRIWYGKMAVIGGE